MAKNNKTPKAPADQLDPNLEQADPAAAQDQASATSNEQATSSQPAAPARTPKIQKAVENTDIGEELDLQGSDISLGRQVNPEEAFAYAMTQADPVAAVRQLHKRNQLKDTTETYALMEKNGMPMGR